MAIRAKYYSVQNTPNTVAADRSPSERSFIGVVMQPNKPAVYFEQNLHQDIRDELKSLVEPFGHPSGWLKGQTRIDGLLDFVFDLPTDPGFAVDAFHMRKMTAVVGGYPIVVEYTNTDTDGDNVIQLDAAPILGGAPPDVKRTDFVFLEVWPTLVAPSINARGTVQVIDNSAVAALDTIKIGVPILTAVVGAPGVDEFTIGANEIITASNIANAINDPGNSFFANVWADSYGTDTVYITAQVAGTAGNSIGLAISNATAFTISGATLSGGADRPNKPSQDTIYRHGNVLSSTTVALPDDLTDPAINVETAQRVQLQYRLRVTGQSEAVNYKTQPDGFSNTTVLARGGETAPVATYPFVPADGATVTANSSAANYEDVDPGLWIAGDGSEASATALQSLTGYVLAIPLCFVHRRNDAYLGGAGAGFDPVANTNGALPSTHPGFVNPSIGAVVPANGSDRPDGGWFDAIRVGDVLDLRRHVCPAGIDLVAELDFQYRLLLDNQLRTWSIDTADKQDLGGGSGDVSCNPLICNEIGRDSGHGGNNVNSGDTTRGVTIRNFDHVSRRFGSQCVVERAVFPLYPQDREVGPVTAPGTVNPGKYVNKDGGAPGNLGWYEGDEIHIDLEALNATTDGFWDPATATVPAGYVADYAPPGAVITDVLVVVHDDGHYNTPTNQNVEILNVNGLGTNHVIITLDSNGRLVTGGRPISGPNPEHPMIGTGASDDGSPRRVFVELEISYPLGSGLTDTPHEVLTPDSTVYTFGPMVENDNTQRPVDMEDPISPAFRVGYREAMVEYIASENGGGAPIGTVTPEDFVSNDTLTLTFLRRIYGSLTHTIGVTDQVTTLPRTVDNGATEYGSSTRVVKLSDPLSGAGHTLAAVTYFGQDPIPNYGALGGGYQVSVYFRGKAPQTVGTKDGLLHGGGGPLPEELEVIPLTILENIWSAQVGVSSPDRGFPYELPLEQIPVYDGGLSTFPGEWYFAATSQISVSSFDANVGALTLQPYVSLDNTVPMVFGGPGNPPDKDIEFRALYDHVDNTQYRPTAMTEPLSAASRHKVLTGILATATEDSLLFRANELLLIVISRFAQMDDDNTIRFLDTDNRTCAAVYRTRNMLLVSNE
jgi:hypothetical protein